MTPSLLQCEVPALERRLFLSGEIAVSGLSLSHRLCAPEISARARALASQSAACSGLRGCVMHIMCALCQSAHTHHSTCHPVAPLAVTLLYKLHSACTPWHLVACWRIL
jgi:hypothetical protein